MDDKPVNRGLLLAIILLSSFFNPFMSTAINVALPTISRQFAMNAIALSWIPMSFLLSSAILLVPFGKLADIWGRKKMLLFGNLFFTVVTLVCAFSTSGTMLIICRGLQGIGGAMILSSGMAIIISAFPPEKRGIIIGINTTAVYIGLSASPLLGGLLTQTFGWQSLYTINACASLFIVVALIFGVKAEWAEAKDDKFDYLGSAIYIIAMLLLMYGFSQLPGTLSAIFAGAGIAGLIYFISIESRSAMPVLNIDLFRHNRVFAFSNLAALINYAATFGITFVLSLYLQNVKGLSPSEAGLILVTQPVLMAIVASISGHLSDRIDSRILSSLGMGIIVTGLILLIFLTEETRTNYLITSLAVLGFGFGLFTSPNTNSIMSSVEKRYLGIASATLGTMRLTGQMMSMAIAAMAINIFIGHANINGNNIQPFMGSVKVIFSVFAILCFIGVFASLARGKTTLQGWSSFNHTKTV